MAVVSFTLLLSQALEILLQVLIHCSRYHRWQCLRYKKQWSERNLWGSSSTMYSSGTWTTFFVIFGRPPALKLIWNSFWYCWHNLKCYHSEWCFFINNNFLQYSSKISGRISDQMMAIIQIFYIFESYLFMNIILIDFVQIF